MAKERPRLDERDEVYEFAPESAPIDLGKLAVTVDDRLAELVELARARNTPATPKTITITDAIRSRTDDAASVSQSIGVFNPTAVPVVLALGGGRASRIGGGHVIPAQSLVVLPISADDVEIAVDPADAAPLAVDPVVVTLLRFKHVQPAGIWRL